MGEGRLLRHWLGVLLALSVLTVMGVFVSVSFLGESVDQAFPTPDELLSDFTDRCLGVTESFERAQVSFDDTPSMRLNQTSEISMAVGAVGAQVEDLPGQGEVLVTCTIDARLVMSPDDATVNPEGWETRRYLPPEPAEWSWLVTPSKAGEIDANIEIRPILVVQGDGGADTTEFATKSYDLDVLVSQGFWDRLSALTTQVQVVLALATALTGLAVVLGIRKWGPALWKRMRARGRSADDQQDDTGYL